uniref:U2A'/phosphoprotein 32 family A C-terminal domain-containing protein n=1 Tax=Setaria digitata TaxID=48799 RepID=A0A915PUH2_9BILA
MKVPESSKEVHAIVEDLSLRLGTSGDGKTDVANYVEFLHNVRNLKVRGARGYVGTSNVIWNSLPFGLNLCKSITALWISDFDVRMIHDLYSVRKTCRRIVIHYSMKKLSDFLLEPDETLPIENHEKWDSLQEIDFSFNEVEEIDESISLLDLVRKMNLSHNLLTGVGNHLQHLTMLTELNLSHNAIENLDSWYAKLGNVKRLHLAGNKISSLNGLHKLYSLEFLDLTDNNIAEPDDIRTVGVLPCLDHLILRGNPIQQVIEYRIKVLEHFGERATEVKLDSRKPDEREADTISVRLALRKAREEKEEQTRKKAMEIDKKSRSLSGHDTAAPVRSF